MTSSFYKVWNQLLRSFFALGLVFLKYISDAFTSVYEKLKADKDADEEDADEDLAERTFWVPKEARWSHLKDNAKKPTINVEFNI